MLMSCDGWAKFRRDRASWSVDTHIITAGHELKCDGLQKGIPRQEQSATHHVESNCEEGSWRSLNLEIMNVHASMMHYYHWVGF